MKTLLHPIAKTRILKFFVLNALVLFLPFLSLAQTDTEFWFAAPYATQAHDIPQAGHPERGGEPVSITVASEVPNTIKIEIPITGVVIERIELTADNLSRQVDLTDNMDLFIPQYGNNAVVGDNFENKGIRIVSENNQEFTAYYEIGARLNPDIFALKGSNALGTEFYTPFQNLFNNCDKYNLAPNPAPDPYLTWDGYPLDLNPSDIADSAFSAFYIVATEDNTIVTIEPTQDIVGHPASAGAFDIVLQRGQTYVGRAAGQLASQHLGGTHIISDKPIAVTIGDDSVEDQNLRGYPSTITDYMPTYEDYNGDQLVPIDIIGNQYIVTRGGVQWSTLDDTNFSGHGYILQEHIFITATEPNTQIVVNGNYIGSPMNPGDNMAIDLSENVQTGAAGTEFALVESAGGQNFYVYHLSGQDREMAGAILPPTNLCTGSYNVGFSRTTGGNDDDEMFRMNIMVKERGIEAFSIDGNYGLLESWRFDPVPGTDWYVASFNFDNISNLDRGQHILHNDSSAFHLGIISSTVWDWQAENGGSNSELMGANYGYFSNYDLVEQAAYFATYPGDTLFSPFGNDVELRSTGGFRYDWTLDQAVITGEDTTFQAIDATVYFDDVNSYRPTVSGLPRGFYQLTVDINADDPVCGNDTIIHLYLTVGDPYLPRPVNDMLCNNYGDSSDVALSCQQNPSFYDELHTCYNLHNLDDYMFYDSLERAMSQGQYIVGYFDSIPGERKVLNEIGTITNSGQTYNAIGDEFYVYNNWTIEDHSVKLTTITNNLEVIYSISNASNYIDLTENAMLEFDIVPLAGANPGASVVVEISNGTDILTSAPIAIDEIQYNGGTYLPALQRVIADFTSEAPASFEGYNEIRLTFTQTSIDETMYAMDNILFGGVLIENADDVRLGNFSTAAGVVQDNYAQEGYSDLEHMEYISYNGGSNGYVQIALEEDDYLNFEVVSSIQMEVMPVYNIATNNWANQSVRLEIEDETGSTMSQTLIINMPDAGALDQGWEPLNFTFTSDDNNPFTVDNKITEIRIYLTGGVNNSAIMNVGIGDISWQGESYFERLENETCMVIEDSTTYYAGIYMPWEEELYMNPANFRVREGSPVNQIEINHLCADRDSTFEHFNLYAYRYDTIFTDTGAAPGIGGALVAYKEWYTHPSRNEIYRIQDPTDYEVHDGDTIYVKIWDVCANATGWIYFDINRVSTPQDQDYELCSDVGSSTTASSIDLTQYNEDIDDIQHFTFDWYRDEAMTDLITDPTNVDVNDGDVFFVNVGEMDGCSNRAQISFSVIETPVVSFDDMAFCQSDDVVELTATPSMGEFTLAGTPITNFDPDRTAGLYNIIYTAEANGTELTCPNSDTAVFEVYQTPDITLTSDPVSPLEFYGTTVINIDSDIAVSLDVDQGGWSPDNMLDDATVLNPTTIPLVDPENEFTVNVISNDHDCPASASIVILVTQDGINPVIPLQEICQDEDVTIPVNIYGGTPEAYVSSWTLTPSVPYTTNADSTEIYLTDVQESIEFTVVVNDPGDDTTATVAGSLIVHERPDIIFDTILSICPNVELPIDGTVTYSSAGTTTGTWTGTGADYITQSGTYNEDLVFSATEGVYNLHYSLNAVYDLTGSGTISCPVSEDIRVRVFPQPELEITVPTELCLYDSVEFIASATDGLPPYTHAWRDPDGTGTAWISSVMDDINNATPRFDALYTGVNTLTYTLTDDNGCIVDTTLAIDVHNKPEVNLIPDLDICQRENNFPISATPQDGLEPYIFTWTGTADDNSTSEGNSVVITEPGDKYITVVVTDQNGCASDMDDMTITVNPNPVAEISVVDAPTAAVCELSTIQLRAFDNVDTDIIYTWSGNVVSPTNGLTTTFSRQVPEDVTVSEIVDLHVEYASTGCDADAEIEVTVWNKPEIGVIRNQSICLNNEVTFEIPEHVAENTNEWMLITPNGDTVDAHVGSNITDQILQLRDYNYVLITTDEHNCKDTAYMTATAYPNPTAVIEPTDPEIYTAYYGVEFSLDGSASSCPDGFSCDLVYEWQNADSITTDNTLPQISTTLFDLEEIQLRVSYDFYDVENDTTITCADSVVKTIFIDGITPVLAITDETECENDTITLVAYASGGDGPGSYTYTWFDPDGNQITGLAPTDSVYRFVIEENGVYEYQVSVEYGNFDTVLTQTSIVTVHRNPVFTISPDPVEVCKDNSVEITATPDDGNSYSYAWSLDGQTTSSENNPYQYNNTSTPGDYQVNVTLGMQYETDLVCETTDSTIVTVHPNPVLDILPDDISMCQESENTFTVDITESTATPYIYEWGIDGDTRSNASTYTYSADENSAGEVITPHTVSVQVTDANGCESEIYESFEVRPIVYDEPSYRNTCSNDPVFIRFPNSTNVNVTWTTPPVNSFANLLDGTVNTFSPDTNEYGDYRFYYSIEDPRFNCPRNDSIDITVYQGVYIDATAEDKCEDDASSALTGELLAGDENDIVYSWQIIETGNNDQISTGINASFERTTPRDYQVMLLASTQSHNCIDSVILDVSVNPNPDVSITVNDSLGDYDLFSNPNIVPNNAEVNLVGSAGNLEVENSIYRWTPANISASSDLSSTEVYTEPINGNVTVELTVIDDRYETQCPGTATKIFDIRQPFDFEIIGQDSICRGDSTLLTIVYPGIQPNRPTFSWRAGSQTGIEYSDSSSLLVDTINTTTYYLTVTEQPYGNAVTHDITVVVLDNPTVNIIATPNMNGQYFNNVDVLMHAVVDTGSIQGFVEQDWYSSVESRMDSLSIQDTNSRYAIFNNKLLDPVTYGYHVVDSFGCSASDVFNYSPLDLPLLSIVVDPVCKGDTVIAYATGRRRMGGDSLVWTFDEGIVDITEIRYADSVGADIPDSVKWLFVEEPRNNYQIWVREVGEGDGFIPRPDATNYFNVYDYPDVTIIGPADVCEFAHSEYTTEITNIFSGVEENDTIREKELSWTDTITDEEHMIHFIHYVDYSWSVMNLDDSLMNQYGFNNINSDVYWQLTDTDSLFIMATNIEVGHHYIDGVFYESIPVSNCPNTADLEVRVHTGPQPRFTYSPMEEIYTDHDVTFTNTSGEDTTGLITESTMFHWDMIGDGVYTEETMLDENILYSYDEMGMFTVTLLAVNPETGCKGEFSDSVEVIPNVNCDIRFPNMFTPDAEQDNFFYPGGMDGIMDEGYTLQIFDRWGHLLWETHDRFAKWDGVYNGEDAKQDTYVFHCKYTCEDGTTAGKNGSVDIYR